MAKDLPYFKFNAAEYLNGDITLEDLYTQGVFINICSLYWFKSGCLQTSEIKRRLKCKDYAIESLIENRIIKVEEDHVRISFLDEQLTERGNISKINSLNGKSGGAPKGNSNAKKAEINNRKTTEKQPKTSNIEEKRREEKRGEERRGELAADESATPEQRSNDFMNKVAEHINSYDKQMLREFFDYWTERNEGGRRMRFEMEKVFDIKKRLATWFKFEKQRKSNGYGQQTNKNQQHVAGIVAAYAETYGKVFGVRPDGQGTGPDAPEN